MNKVLIKNSTLTNIAEAIRGHDQSNTPLMKPSEMPEYIANIDTEKVTIDGNKVKENLDLFVYQDTMEFVLPFTEDNAPDILPGIVREPHTNYFSYSSEDILPFLPGSTNLTLTSSTEIAFKYPPFTITNIKGEDTKIALPTITIPSTSEFPINNNIENMAQYFIIQNHLYDFYLIVLRTYAKGGYWGTEGNGYMTIFKLVLDTTNYNNSYWEQKCHEVRLFPSNGSSSGGRPRIPQEPRQFLYINDDEAIIYGISGQTSKFGNTGVYIFNFKKNSYKFVDTSSIFGNNFSGSTSEGFVAKIQDKIYLYQTDENISKCIEIDANTYKITNSMDAPSFYTTNKNLVTIGVFMHNNKVYFNGIKNSNYYLYEFIPSTWDVIKIIEINDITDTCLFANRNPRYICNSEFYYHFDLHKFEFLGPYYLPTISEIPKEFIFLDPNANEVSQDVRYFFLPQYNCLLTYSEAFLSGWGYYLYKAYIRRLDNKPLAYTTLAIK